MVVVPVLVWVACVGEEAAVPPAPVQNSCNEAAVGGSPAAVSLTGITIGTMLLDEPTPSQVLEV